LELCLTSSQVFVVTGAATGVGLELAKILYAKNSTVYIATRSSAKISAAITAIQTLHPSSKGRLEPLLLDLSDLSTIKPAADAFLSKEARLDGLIHNAGVMVPPEGSTGAQGHELQLATNVLGPFLLTQCLEERLISTASSAPKGSVRVVWVTSMIAVGTPKGGMVWDEVKGSPKLHKAQNENYMQSKVGDFFLAHEYAERVGQKGIISVVCGVSPS
jgi:retinol dehydrogenase 12